MAEIISTKTKMEVVKEKRLLISKFIRPGMMIETTVEGEAKHIKTPDQHELYELADGYHVPAGVRAVVLSYDFTDAAVSESGVQDNFSVIMTFMTVKDLCVLKRRLYGERVIDGYFWYWFKEIKV